MRTFHAMRPKVEMSIVAHGHLCVHCLQCTAYHMYSLQITLCTTKLTCPLLDTVIYAYIPCNALHTACIICRKLDAHCHLCIHSLQCTAYRMYNLQKTLCTTKLTCPLLDTVIYAYILYFKIFDDVFFSQIFTVLRFPQKGIPLFISIINK
jgi:hypothetical protein